MFSYGEKKKVFEDSSLHQRKLLGDLQVELLSNVNAHTW